MLIDEVKKGQRVRLAKKDLVLESAGLAEAIMLLPTPEEMRKGNNDFWGYPEKR